MLVLIPNENKTAIQMMFLDHFSEEQQFVADFDLDQAKSIGEDLVKIVAQIKREKRNAQKDNAESF